jgi:hypothetical protein
MPAELSLRERPVGGLLRPSVLDIHRAPRGTCVASIC